MAILTADKVSVSFGDKVILRDLSLAIEQGEIVSILGPNGSGKSTFLKALSRNLKIQTGSILLDGRNIQGFSAKEMACHLATLHQASRAPGDLTVRDLIEYGRFPYQHWWKGNEKEDRLVVEWALEQTSLSELASRRVNTLSGGEQQRAWIAMALAQKPRILLLDEPTTYLDLCHQLEIMELITQLNKEQGISIVMVLHDMNHAARYSDRVAVLCKGSLYDSGTPVDTITPTMLREVFGVEADIWLDNKGRPVCLAQSLTASTSACKQQSED
jgi:iron complex transport system ATP-binding protein